MKKPKESLFEDDDNPLSLILITSGSRGQRLLFRYPYIHSEDVNIHQPHSKEREETLTKDFESTAIDQKDDCALFLPPMAPSTSSAEEHYVATEHFLQNGELFGFSDPLLATMLAPNLTLCNVKFELCLDNVKFVGYPVLVNHGFDDSGFEECLLVDDVDYNNLMEDVMIKIVHIVFVVRHNIDIQIIEHYQNISKMLGKVLRHEEKRSRYLNCQRQIMVTERDNAEKLPESDQNPYELILRRSELAQDLVKIYDAICQTGIVNVTINDWLNFSYCLPHKVHRYNGSLRVIDTAKVNKYIGRIKPYHTLLLTDETESEKENLIKLLPHDASPVLVRLINLSNHIKNFQTLCQDADISLPQIFQLVAHLVYWGKGTVIYPLAESNIYVISHSACTEIDSGRAEDFVRSFPKRSLHNILARFSFPITLGEYRNPLSSVRQQSEQAQIVKWLLKRGLLKQLHTYVYIMPEVTGEDQHEHENQRDISTEEKSFKRTLRFLKANEHRIFERFSVVEKRSLIKLSSSMDKEDLCFFINMSKYFRGEHHLEDIMYYENVPRSKLLILIDKFRSMLITVQHEDTATNRLV